MSLSDPTAGHQASSDAKNGFAEPLSNLQPAADANDAALNLHRQALYVLTQKDRPIPSLQEMELELAQPDDLSNLKNQITELENEHLVDMQRLYDAHAAEYEDEVLSRYHSYNDLLAQGDTSAVGTPDAQQKSLYAAARQDIVYLPSWEDDVARMKYTYLKQLTPLHKRRLVLEAQEEEARKRREAQFPKTAAEFHTKAKDVQLRAATFLMSVPPKQEKMLSQFGWAWRQVQPLKDEFERNAEFKATIQAMVIELEVRDPRRR